MSVPYHSAYTGTEVDAAVASVNNATALATASQIVKRDGSGGTAIVALTLSGTVTLATGQTITTTANGHVTLTPHGTGEVRIGYLTANRVMLVGANGKVTDDANFQYDSTGVLIGLGSATSAGQRLRIQYSGAVILDTFGIVNEVAATSSTASVKKYGMYLGTTGTWNGAGAVNYALYIAACSDGATNWAIYNNSAANVYLGTGNVGIGTTLPTAYLHIKAGTAGVGTAPLKLTAGTNLTIPEAGAIEFDGT